MLAKTNSFAAAALYAPCERKQQEGTCCANLHVLREMLSPASARDPAAAGNHQHGDLVHCVAVLHPHAPDPAAAQNYLHDDLVHCVAVQDLRAHNLAAAAGTHSHWNLVKGGAGSAFFLLSDPCLTPFQGQPSPSLHKVQM